MTTEEIEAYLAVYNCKSISEAAKSLFINQSALSIRIKTLETELGVQLFHRRRGSRTTQLTEIGERFYPLALQYINTIRSMKHISDQIPERLRVSAFNSLGTYLLPEVWDVFTDRYPNVDLQMQDMELEAATASIMHGNTDASFVALELNNKYVTSTLVFVEPFVLLCAADSDYPGILSVKDLVPRREVYVGWCAESIEWHTRNFGASIVPQIVISHMEPLRHFLSKANNWAIVPLSVAVNFEHSGRFRCCKLLVPMPNRSIYCLQNAKREKSKLIEQLLECVSIVGKKYEGIQMFV